MVSSRYSLKTIEKGGMIMSQTVSEQQFQQLLQSKLGDSWECAKTVFQNCGPNLSFDVTNVLLHAVGQDKVDEVLSIIEKHYDEHLYFQHPEIRGTVSDQLLGVNKTQSLFFEIYRDVLKLPLPVPA